MGSPAAKAFLFADLVFAAQIAFVDRMPPCHTKPYVQPGVIIAPESDVAPQDQCDYCGSARLVWRKCKLICANCHQINKSCADL